MAEIATPDLVVNLVGTARSAAEIRSVEWTNDRGGRGSANGKENWVTGNIVLKLGVNNITVTATDADGISSAKSIAVDREELRAATDGVQEPVAMYSYSSDLRNAAPLEGASITPGPVYVFLEPGTDWSNRGIRRADYHCCKGISGPGEGTAYGASLSVSFRPWSMLVDMSGLEAGGTRRLRVVASFTDGSDTDAHNFDFGVASGDSRQNSAPTISGTPPGGASVGLAYRFRPTATDADGDTLSFSISGKPSWATFNSSTGVLRGTPGSNDTGTYSNIVISTSDGRSTSSLAPFSIVVKQAAIGTATLSWVAPTKRVDNSPLTDLAGFTVHYGQSPTSYNNEIAIDNPGISFYVVENLTAGTWYFAVTAKDSAGQTSDFSNQGQKTIL